MKKIYIAYGANTNRRAMSSRCPNARPIGSGFIVGHRFKFNNVADIVPHDKSKHKDAPAVAWQITPDCEKALDRFEGFPSLYRKINVLFKGDGEYFNGFAYKMNYTGFHTPSPMYVEGIRTGLKNFFNASHWHMIDDSIDSAIVESFRMEEKGSPLHKRIGGRQWR
tara:strand:+ start:183 stop:680 length:498 start_codon:yes stop_codon:yes gene_type:complete